MVPNLFFSLGKGSFIGIIGVINILIGAGLLFEQILAQFLVKILSWIQVIFGPLGFLYLFVIHNPKTFWIALLGQIWAVGIPALQLHVINKVGDA